MKKTRWLIPCTIAVLVLVLGVVGCAPGNSSQVITIPARQNTGIWVTGQGEVTTVPDIVNLSLGVEVKADTVTAAQSEAAAAMDAVMQALKDSGVAEKDIQTQRYGVYPVTRWTEDKGEEILGYRVTNMVVAKIREVDKTGAVIDAVAKAGGDDTRIQNISFTIDDPKPYYEEARAKAVEDAANKAKQFASLTSVKLGQPTYISEGAIYTPPTTRGYYEEALPAPSPAGTSISPGELKVRVNVQIAYAIS